MILMNNFKAEPPELREAMLAAVIRVLESGWYVLGQEVQSFERQWAAACGVRNCVGVGNGMDAIEIALRALDIGPGDEVITTSMTAFATVLAILRAGATPVLADIDPASALMTLASVDRCLTSKTKAVILVHLYGQLRDMKRWQEKCVAHRIALIEDCAQAHWASWRGTASGSFGVVGAYSFYPTKNLGGLGDGGALVTNDLEVADRARKIRDYGQSERYQHPVVGMNSRLDELQAALLSERLKWLPGFTQRRREIAELYRDGILNPLVGQLASPEEPSAHVNHLFVVTCERREVLVSYLKESGVQSLIHYPFPIHCQVPCRDIRRDPNGLGASELHANICLSIPCNPQMSDYEVRRVIDVINKFRGI